MAIEGFKRKLTATLGTNAAGCRRLMGEDEAATVRTLETCEVDSPGDNLLSEFAGVVDEVFESG